MTQHKSLRALMAQLIDYAGLFPPASLSLDEAIRNYAAYLKSEDKWMLGRFIIPASRLAELHSYVSLFSRNAPLRISALGRKSEDSEACRTGLNADLQLIAEFTSMHGHAATVEVLELPLPPSTEDAELLKYIAAKTSEQGVYPFCELIPRKGWDERCWESQLYKTIDAIGIQNANKASTEPWLGAKLRTGGVTADAFPKPSQVASVILGCRNRGIPLKFTAGLHHPFRMHRDEVGTKMHGFVNVFAAGMLAKYNLLCSEEIKDILTDENPDHFCFTDKGLTWREHVVTSRAIVHLRKLVCSFGSCSFDEPREDLRRVHILS
ncbi:hypothetical protein KIK04_11055 [Paenibacillus sp. 481]|nr:hypothetical protein KIK04_11055 [Paenibacillus sp. 481]